MDNLYIYKKEIDWSSMHEGINIPVSIQLAFYDEINSYLKQGESRNITIIFDGKEYDVTLRTKHLISKNILIIKTFCKLGIQ